MNEIPRWVEPLQNRTRRRNLALQPTETDHHRCGADYRDVARFRLCRGATLLRRSGWQRYWRNSKFPFYPLQIVEDRSQVMAEL
ncbi:MAG: hypothetical protein Q8O52_06305, partial [Sulfuritalea sp.]|nr:hypothetical protein [Sulfuritalea sp.]